MKRLTLRFTMVILLLSVGGVFTNCAKSGCPASMALQNETMGEPGAKKSKKSKQPKSGIVPPAGKKGTKY